MTPLAAPRLWRAPLGAVLVALLLLAGAAAVSAAYDPLVEAAQRTLAERGYTPGPVDGLMGRKTRNAIRAFQVAKSLPATGRLDPPTRAALGLEDPAGPSPGGQAPGGPAPPAPAPAPAPATSLTPAAQPRPVHGLLTYAAMGWHGPEDTATMLARAQAATGVDEIRARSGELVVSDTEHVFVLSSGATPPGDCNPSAGRLSLEFLFGVDGPVTFRSLAGSFCQLGIGIVLLEGMTVRMEAAIRSDTAMRAGPVRLEAEGLRVLR